MRIGNACWLMCCRHLIPLHLKFIQSDFPQVFMHRRISSLVTWGVYVWVSYIVLLEASVATGDNRLSITLEYLGDAAGGAKPTTFRSKDVLPMPILVNVEFTAGGNQPFTGNDADGTKSASFVGRLFQEVSEATGGGGIGSLSSPSKSEWAMERLEVGSCGGRWQRRWRGSAGGRPREINALISRLSQHISCSQVPASMCFVSNTSLPSAEGEDVLMGAHYLKEAVSRTIGGALGNTLGLVAAKPPLTTRKQPTVTTNHNGHKDSSTQYRRIRSSAIFETVTPTWLILLLDWFLLGGASRTVPTSIFDPISIIFGRRQTPTQSIPVMQPLHTWPIGQASTRKIVVPLATSSGTGEDHAQSQRSILRHCFTEVTSHEKLCTDTVVSYVKLLIADSFHAHAVAMKHMLSSHFDSSEEDNSPCTSSLADYNPTISEGYYNQLRNEGVLGPLLPPFADAALHPHCPIASGDIKRGGIPPTAPSAGLLFANALLPSHIAFLSAPFHSVEATLVGGDRRVSLSYTLTQKAEVKTIRELVHGLGVRLENQVDANGGSSHFVPVFKETSESENVNVAHSYVTVAQGNALSEIVSLDHSAVQPIITLTDSSEQTTICKTETSLSSEGEIKGLLTFDTQCVFNPSDVSEIDVEVDEFVVWPLHTLLPVVHLLESRVSLAPPISSSTLQVKQFGSRILLREVTPQTITFVIRHRLNVTASSAQPSPHPPNALQIISTVPFHFPYLRMDQYPYDVNKAYLFPPVTTRTIASADTSSRTASGEPTGTDDAISHAGVLKHMFPPSDVPVVERDGARKARVTTTYSRSTSPTATTLPTADPAMVFNALSLATCLISVAVGGSLATAIRKRY